MLSIVLCSKNYNNIDFLLEKTNLNKLDDIIEIVIVLFKDSYKNTTKRKNIIIINGEKNGIYSSYNQGIKHSKNKYYLIVGDDDYLLHPVLLMNYIKNNLLNHDMIFFSIKKNEKIVKGFNLSKIKTTILGIFPSHTCGIIIKKKLHEEFGYYNLKYKLLADQFFILMYFQKRSKILYVDKYFFQVGYEGASSNYFKSLDELSEINNELKINKKFIFLKPYLTLKRKFKIFWEKLKF
jgi:hypothetical protein